MVEWIEYKGQKLPFVYNYYAMSNAIAQKDKYSDEKMLDAIVYFSIEAGCEEMDRPFSLMKSKEEKEITMKDAGFIIGKVGVDEINRILGTFKPKEEGDDSKKK